MEYIATFFTNSGAIKFNRYLNSLDVKNQAMPVPRKITSNCGIGVKFSYSDELENILIDDVETVFSINNGEYNCVYSEE
ncbi:DUF3343 domain-containing protein [Hathewaya histolytica]|uniref:Protein of uncharacterized function (DUF3343) n=1 Tax=Hathewaya histolytica TaxID=1498 RepID=A0A4U9R059_HATHI|nr:DUF3343 domain-containing protein [Hathewaya histolytica]VTQ83243.1 Protein of uncharacterised function (DUF3343) [Hathewaya histolytica]